MANNTQTILMADDDPDDLDMIEFAINHIQPDADLHKVSSGKAVIDYLKKQPDNKLPCLIVLDYNMPELTGSEVLSKICMEKRYDHIPKIILSTSNAAIHINECMSNGATEYFVKPSNMAAFKELAKSLLDYCKGASS